MCSAKVWHKAQEEMGHAAYPAAPVFSADTEVFHEQYADYCIDRRFENLFVTHFILIVYHILTHFFH